jgi:hypothetical protein
MKILSSARIAVIDADFPRRAALCAALGELGMLRLQPAGSLDEACDLAAGVPFELCVINLSGRPDASPLNLPIYSFDPHVTPAILIADNNARDMVRAAATCGYSIVLAAPAAPRLIYRRIGSILQRVRRQGRRAPKMAPVITAPAELQDA